MGATGAALHGELDLSDEGGGDLPEAAGHSGTWSERGRLSGTPRGVSWLTGGVPGVAVRGGSAMASTTV
jgi:hypothetical protein